MKRIFLAGSLLAAALAVAPSVHSSDPPDRPPGVAVDAWVPISERVGFVLVLPNKVVRVTDAQVLMLRPPASGYFMLKGASGWTRILIVDPSRAPADAG
jgi:hypothetical protein